MRDKSKQPHTFTSVKAWDKACLEIWIDLREVFVLDTVRPLK